MALVTIDLVAGAFTRDQKRAILEDVTEALLAVIGEPMRSLTWVRINEIAAGDSAIGGQPLDAETLGRFTARPECVAALKAGTAPGRGVHELLGELAALTTPAPPREASAHFSANPLKAQGSQS